MIIFPTTEIEWGGKEYTTKVTMGTINKIENVFSLSGLARRIGDGEDPPISHLAVLYGNLLRSGRCNVSDKDVYHSMMGDIEDSKVSQEEIMVMCMHGLQCCFTERPKEAKPTKKKVNRKRS